MVYLFIYLFIVSKAISLNKRIHISICPQFFNNIGIAAATDTKICVEI
jgi:hypothetical protein